MRSKTRLIFFLSLMAAMMVVTSTTKADTATWDLTNCNIASLCQPGGIGTVTLSTAGQNASEVIDVTLSLISGYGLFGSGKGSGAFGFNFSGNDAGVGITNISNPFSFNGNSGQMDGFGSFEFIINGPVAAHATSPLSFTVTCAGGCTSVSQLFTEISSGGSGSTPFVAQVRNNQTGLTGFAGATPSSPTPEPASLMLMGSGLLGIAGLVRRRVASAIPARLKAHSVSSKASSTKPTERQPLYQG
jgi:hypothetical protein